MKTKFSCLENCYNAGDISKTSMKRNITLSNKSIFNTRVEFSKIKLIIYIAMLLTLIFCLYPSCSAEAAPLHVINTNKNFADLGAGALNTIEYSGGEVFSITNNAVFNIDSILESASGSIAAIVIATSGGTVNINRPSLILIATGIKQDDGVIKLNSANNTVNFFGSDDIDNPNEYTLSAPNGSSGLYVTNGEVKSSIYTSFDILLNQVDGTKNSAAIYNKAGKIDLANSDKVNIEVLGLSQNSCGISNNTGNTILPNVEISSTNGYGIQINGAGSITIASLKITNSRIGISSTNGTIDINGSAHITSTNIGINNTHGTIKAKDITIDVGTVGTESAITQNGTGSITLSSLEVTKSTTGINSTKGMVTILVATSIIASKYGINGSTGTLNAGATTIRLTSTTGMGINQNGSGTVTLASLIIYNSQNGIKAASLASTYINGSIYIESTQTAINYISKSKLIGGATVIKTCVEGIRINDASVALESLNILSSSTGVDISHGTLTVSEDINITAINIGINLNTLGSVIGKDATIRATGATAAAVSVKGAELSLNSLDILSGHTGIYLTEGSIEIADYVSISTTYRGIAVTSTGKIKIIGDVNIVTSDMNSFAIIVNSGKVEVLGKLDARNSGNGISVLNGGEITLKDAVKIDTTTGSETTPAIYISGDNSKLNANFDSNITSISSNGVAIIYSSVVWSALNIDYHTAIYLYNASISNTYESDYDLIQVTGGVTPKVVHQDFRSSELYVRNSSLTASKGGWLLSVTREVVGDDFKVTTTVKDSVFTFNAIDTNLSGSIYTETGNELFINLVENSEWTLTPKGITYESSFTKLLIDSSIVNASAGSFFIEGDIRSNNGVITLANNQTLAGKKLTINGNYEASSDAMLVLSVSRENYKSDQLLINGNTSGKTIVDFKVVGLTGSSNAPYEIPVIQVNGISEYEAFVYSGRVVLGAYDYNLDYDYVENSHYWCLTRPQGAPTRPEGDNYVSNLIAANTMFIMNLYERVGESQQTTKESDTNALGNLWLYYNNGYNEFSVKSNEVRLVGSNRMIIHIGSDIVKFSFNNENALHIGLLGAYGISSNDTKSSDGINSTGEVRGYNVGVYGTWYSHEDNKSGLYADIWLTWTNLKAKVEGDSLSAEEYRLKGFSASVETGYSFLIIEKWKSSLWIQPKVQLTWNGVKADEHEEQNGTIITGSTNNVRIVAGAKLYLRNYVRITTSDFVQAFCEFNWIHNTKEHEVSLSGVEFSQMGSKNIFELKVGFEFNLNEKFNVWGSLGYQIGSNFYKDVSILLGVQNKF